MRKSRLSTLILILQLGYLVCAGQEYFNNSIVQFLDQKLQLHLFARLSTPELISLRGYPVETHHVTTEDGYILVLHRIPYGINPGEVGSLRNITKIPVLLEHGGAQSSIDWILNEEVDNCLGFILADAGYDVWLGNIRGNPYSDKHLNLTLRNKTYWDFSLEELGIYDLPAMIDYILLEASQPKLHFIGYSLGTAAFFAGLSERPEYNQKIHLGISIGVAAFIHHSLYFRILCAFVQLPLEVIHRLYGSFPLPNPFLARATRTFIPHLCNENSIPIIPDLCWFFWTLGLGYDDFQIPKGKLSLIFSKLPTPTSSKSFLHLCQNVRKRSFGKFDYGPDINQELYGSSVSPVYNLARVTAAISLFSAPADLYCVYEDIKQLADQLPNVVDLHRIPFKYFNHVDFVYGKDANVLVYQRMLNLMANYTINSIHTDNDLILSIMIS